MRARSLAVVALGGLLAATAHAAAMAPRANECPTPDTKPLGFAWQYLFNPAPNNDSDYTLFSVPAAYDIDTHWTTLSGSTPAPSNPLALSGACDSGRTTLYDYTADTLACTSFGIDCRGYIRAPTAGTYVAHVAAADDLVLAWTGAVAADRPATYNDPAGGFNRANAAVDVVAPRAPARVELVLEQGYVPLRVLFAQDQGPYDFSFEVTGPDGEVAEIVRYSCDEADGAPGIAG